MSNDQTGPASGSMPGMPPAPSLVGEVLDGRYRIIRKLGEGGMGEVYAAEHIHIEKKFAIKLLRPEIVSNPEAVSRFRQEARSSSSIGHRNIIAIEDFGTLNDGRIYMCMELLNGAALNDLITTPQPADRLLNILIQTGHGLAAAHAKNIVHRDMKPENIFVTITANNEDVPKLLDFGIAKVAGNDGNNNLTKTGTIFGTPFYMAPEQALGNTVDARTDIYAMGVIMYEVFAGELPFKGESFMGILTQHITTNPQPVQNVAAKNGRALPPGLAEIITRCMSKDPNQRFSTMDELVNSLIAIYRSIAGAGMSTYMEAFTGGVPSSRMPVPTPPPLTGGYPPPPGHTPTVNVTPHGMPQMAPPVGPSGAHAVTGQGGLYDSGSSVVQVPKKSKAPLIIGIFAVLAIGGGVTAFLVTREEGGGSGEGPVAETKDAGAAETKDADKVVVNTPDAGGGAPATPDAATAGNGSDKPPETPDAAVAATPDAAVVEPDAGVTATPDAQTAVATVKVKIFLKSPAVPFEAFEGTTKLFDGPDAVEITPGTPRTITLKVKGYKPLDVTVTGKEKDGIVRATLKPAPIDCTVTLVDAKNATCIRQFCKTHQSDAKCSTPVIAPPALDCTATIKEPKNKACVKQYCKLHENEPRCQAE
jgi:tRNA A-37 threonylcarbamoyl transferase component Bud32